MINTSSISYSGPNDTGFEEDERVTLSRQVGSNEGNDCIPFNAFSNFHNHPNNDQNMCSVEGFHHFDFRYWHCDRCHCAVPFWHIHFSCLLER